MSSIILPGQSPSTAATKGDRVPLITGEWEDEYEDEPDFADAFEPALWLLLHQHDITMDPTLSKEDQLKGREIGVLEASFWKWKIFVNWQTKWAQVIPPQHMAVHFNGEQVGIISPYLTVRTCWNCRLGDPTRSPGGGGPANNGFDEDSYYIKTPTAQLLMNPDLPRRIPAVYPAYPCPRCKQYDWFARSITIEQFQRDAAEHLAVETGEDEIATDMRVTHDVLGRDGKMGYARTNV